MYLGAIFHLSCPLAPVQDQDVLHYVFFGPDTTISRRLQGLDALPVIQLHTKNILMDTYLGFSFCLQPVSHINRYEVTPWNSV